MTDRTRRALQFGTRAGIFMAVLAALNFALYGWRLATGVLPRLGLLLAACSISFLLLGALFFALAYADPSQSPETTPRLWIRPLRRRHTLIAYLLAGWLAALLIVGVGDYKLRQRLPTFGELNGYLLVALLIGPAISLLAAWQMHRFRRIERVIRDND